MIKDAPGFVPIPNKLEPIIKVIITNASTGTTMDIYQRILRGEFRRQRFREGTGNFKILTSNVGGVYDNLFSKGDTVEFYADRIGGNTKQFKGKIDSVKSNIVGGRQSLEILGRYHSFPLDEAFIPRNYSAPLSGDVIAKDLIDVFNANSDTDFTYANIQAFINSMRKNWGRLSVRESLGDICVEAEADGYVDLDSDVHLFPENTVINNSESIIEGQNLLSLSGFGINSANIRNNVRVIGDDGTGIPVIWTTLSGSGDRELKPVFDVNIDTVDEARNISKGILNTQSEEVPDAQVVCYGLTYVVPGQNITMLAPRFQIFETLKIIEYTHFIGREIKFRWQTSLKIEKEHETAETIIRKNIKSDDQRSNINNPNNLHYSYNFTFDNDTNIKSMTGCRISDGKLVMIAGNNTAEMITHAQNAPGTLTEGELRVVGFALADTKFYVSPNDGLNWEEVTREVLHTMQITSGRRPAIKVIMRSFAGALPEIESLGFLYNVNL